MSHLALLRSFWSALWSSPHPVRRLGLDLLEHRNAASSLLADAASIPPPPYVDSRLIAEAPIVSVNRDTTATDAPVDVTTPLVEATPEHVAAVVSLTTDPLPAPTGLANLEFVYFADPLAPTDPPAATPPASSASSSAPDPSAPANAMAGTTGSTSLVVIPPTPPSSNTPQAPSTPPPVVPPPTNPPAMPQANDDSYTVTGGTLTVSAANGLLANDTNPTGQPMTANVVNTPVYGSVAVNPDGSFTYTNTNPGLTTNVTFTYQASAGGSISNPATVTLNLSAPTPAGPTLLNPGDQASNTGEPVSLQLVGNGPAGDALAYSAAGLPSGLTVDPATGAIAGQIDHSAALANAVTVCVTDTVTGLSASQSFNWAVTVVSHAPTLDPIDGQTNAAGDDVFVLAYGSSVDNSPLTYSIMGQPGGVAIDPDTGAITGTIAGSAFSATPYQVTVTVSDGTLSASQTFAWSVGAIQLANPGDQTNAIGGGVSLPIAVQDYAGGTPTFSATNLPNGLAIDPTTGLVSGIVAPGSVWQGDFSVTVTATDGTNTASQTFDWTVTPAINTTAPTITDPGPQSNISGDAVSLQINASSAAGNLVYAASGLPGNLMIDPATGIISGSLASSDVGTYSATVTVTDPLGGTASDTFSWGVAGAPVTLSVRSLTAVEGKQLGPVQVATFTTPDLTAGQYDYSATITWGDGAVSAGTVSGANGSFSVQGSHTYPVTGGTVPSYPLLVQIADANAKPLATGMASVTMVQESASLQVSDLYADDDNVVEYTQVATLTVSDLGATAGSYTALIDWGEGTPTAGDIVGVGNGVFQIWGGHPYKTDGDHTFGVYVYQAAAALTLLAFQQGKEKAASLVIPDVIVTPYSGPRKLDHSIRLTASNTIPAIWRCSA